MGLYNIVLLFPLLLSFLPFLSAIPIHNSEYTTLSCPNTTTNIATTDQQFAAITSFNTLLFQEKQSSKAFSTYVATDLINHAPDVPGDGSKLAHDTISGLLEVSDVEIEQVFVGQDHSTTYFKATTANGTIAAMEVFRLSGTCLVEHWVVQVPVTKSSNPHAYF